MILQQISIFIENKTGRLAEVSKILADHGINMLALSLAETTDFGVLRLIVANPQEAVLSLKESGLTVKLTEVIGIYVDHKPGGLVEAFNSLTANGVAVEYLYAFVGCETDGAIVILRVDHTEKAAQVLTDDGIRLVTQDSLSKM